jgi:hypothetical protein
VPTSAGEAAGPHDGAEEAPPPRRRADDWRTVRIGLTLLCAAFYLGLLALVGFPLAVLLPRAVGAIWFVTSAVVHEVLSFAGAVVFLGAPTRHGARALALLLVVATAGSTVLVVVALLTRGQGPVVALAAAFLLGRMVALLLFVRAVARAHGDQVVANQALGVMLLGFVLFLTTFAGMTVSGLRRSGDFREMLLGFFGCATFGLLVYTLVTYHRALTGCRDSIDG